MFICYSLQIFFAKICLNYSFMTPKKALSSYSNLVGLLIFCNYLGITLNRDVKMSSFLNSLPLQGFYTLKDDIFIRLSTYLNSYDFLRFNLYFPSPSLSPSFFSSSIMVLSSSFLGFSGSGSGVLSPK